MKYAHYLIVGFILLIAGCKSYSVNTTVSQQEEFPPFTGNVNIKLIVEGKDIDIIRQKLINELGTEANIKDYDSRGNEGLRNLPFLTIKRARVEDLKILEISGLVEFFYSDEPKPVITDNFGRPTLKQPIFQWFYTKEYGYQIGNSRSPYAEKLYPELIYEIYKSEGKNIPTEIIDKWNRVK